MPLILRPPSEHVSLVDRLRSLAQFRQWVLVSTSLLILLASILSIVIVLTTVDGLAPLPGWARALGLSLLLGVTGWILFTSVRPVLKRPASPLLVAQLLEERYPDLNDSLASAICFLEEANPLETRGSQRFRSVAVRRAENLTERTELQTIVPMRPLTQAALVSAITVVIALTLTFWDLPRANMALMRLLDPYGKHVWPAQTRIEIIRPDPQFKILAKGDPFAVEFRLHGKIPDQAMVRLRLQDARVVEEHVSLPVHEAHVSETTSSVLFEPDRVSRSFSFKVTANDAETDWIPVTVSPPPKLVPRDGRPSPQLELAFPSYTKLPRMELPDGTGLVECVAGTTVKLIASADRRIVAASLQYQGEPLPISIYSAVAPLASAYVPAAAFAELLAESFQNDIAVTVAEPSGTTLSVEFMPPMSGIFALKFTDESGLTGVRLLDIRSFPDPEPNVTLERPAPGRDPLVVLPTGVIRTRSRADDRLFALKSLFLEFRVNEEPYQPIALIESEGSLLATPAIAGGLASGASLLPPILLAERTIPVGLFLNERGVPVSDGDTIYLRAAATDWDDFTILKMPGRSEEVAIRVMSTESITAQIQKDLAALRPELSRSRDTQKEAADKLKELRKSADAGKLSDEDRDKLSQVEQNQRQLRGQISDPRDGTRSKVEQLRETARRNDLPRSSVTERAEAVARALEDLEREHMQEVEGAISAAKQAAITGKDARALKEPLARATRHQDGALEKLETALEELEQWAGASEIRGEARNLKDQVAQAQSAGRKLAEQTPQGVPAEQLKLNERSALNRVAEDLDKAADQASRLITKADRVATEKHEQSARDKAAAEAKMAQAQESEKQARESPKGSDAARAAESRASAQKAEALALAESAARAEQEAQALEQASRRSGGQQIPNQLKKAAEAQRNNRPGDASQAASEAIQRLNRMVDSLAEKQEDSPDILARKKKLAAEQIDQLANNQDRLSKKLEQARQESDPGARADQLQQLAAEQDQLRKETEQLSRKLNRDGQSESADQLRRAAQKMQQSQEELAEGRDPGSKPEEALDRLDDAREQLEQPRMEDQDQLMREKREQLAELLKGFVDRQRAAVVESERITQAAIAEKRWSRPLQASLVALADRQKGLAEELRSLSEKQLTRLKVFERMALQAADNMEKASKRILERKDDAVIADPEAFEPDAEKTADEVARRPMRSALTRLEQIASALKNDEKKPKAAKVGGMPPGEEGGPMPGGGGPGSTPNADGVPPLAQLKALRDWQADINERTAAFARAHPDRDALTEDDQDELRELEQAQKEIAELFEQLVPLFQPGANIP